MVIGLNHSSAPLAMRERFWISENRRYAALRKLQSAEGIEELVLLVTCNRTEFIVWASEPTLAANSVLQFLTAEYGLKLKEWEHFYRLLDEAALLHVFRVTSSLDSMALGEPQIVAQVKAAWQQARTVGTSARMLEVVFEKALTMSKKVRTQTAIGELAVSIPRAAVDLARQLFGSLEGRSVLLIGGCKISELSGRYLAESGVTSVTVISQTLSAAQELAHKLGASSAALEDRWQHMVSSDIVICCSGCPHVILTRTEAERIVQERDAAPMMIFDLGIPRDIDHEVHRVDGILLYDLDGLEHFVKQNQAERRQAALEAEKMVAAEAHVFYGELQAEAVVPTIIALRRRLEELCRQELESFTKERGPFTREQDQALHAITAQVIQKIASSLARELKGLPEKQEQEQMTAAIQRLFHLESPSSALAGTRSEKYAEGKDRPLALRG